MRSQPPAPTTAVSAPPWLSSLTRPSRMWTTRSAISVEAGSWLTTIAAERCSETSSDRSARTSRADVRVEVARRLVGDEEPRAIGERRAERDALLLSARELATAGRRRGRAARRARAAHERVRGARSPGRPRARAARRRAPPPSARLPEHASSAGRRTRERPVGSGRARADEACTRSWPATTSEPADGRASPARTRMSVVLPGATRAEHDARLVLLDATAKGPGAPRRRPLRTDRPRTARERRRPRSRVRLPVGRAACARESPASGAADENRREQSEEHDSRDDQQRDRRRPRAEARRPRRER